MKIWNSIDRTTAFCLAIIIVVGLIPLTWYKPSYTVVWGDSSPYWFNSPKTISGDMNMWMDSIGTGGISNYPTLSALFIPMYLLQLVGLPNGIIQVVVWSVLLICSGLSMFFFLSNLLGKKPLPLLIGSLFYMLSMIFMLNIVSIVGSWTHAFLPLILGLFVKVIRKRVNGEPSWKLLLGFIAACSLFGSFLTDSPPLLIIGVLSLSAVFIYLCITGRNLKIIKESIKTISLAILASIWWLIPFILNVLQVLSMPGQSITSQSYVLFDTRSSILNVLWFNPLWSWSGMYYQYTSFYSNPIVILATFTPIIFAAAVLLFKGKEEVMKYFFFAIVLILIFLAKGAHSPFGQVFQFLATHLPAFGSLFREPASKFTLMITIFTAPLIALSVDTILTRSKSSKRMLKKVISIGLIVIISASIIISALPMFLGQVTESESSNIPFSSYVKVPAYWDQAGEFFSNDSSDFRILIAPDDPSPYVGYNWGYWGADGIPYRFIQKPVLYSRYGYQPEAVAEALNATYQAIENGSITTLDNLLTIQNIKYVLLRNDIDWNYSENVNPLIIKNGLDNCTNLQFIKTIGELSIYEYKNWKSSLFMPAVIPLDYNVSTDSKNISFLPMDTTATTLNYTKISPNEYQVHVETSKPFYLYFSASYDPDWKIIGTETSWYSAPFNNEISTNHSTAYGFENLWFINKTGSYNLTVYYTPQSYLYYGILISGLTLFSVSIYAVTAQILVKEQTKKVLALRRGNNYNAYPAGNKKTDDSAQSPNEGVIKY